MKKLTFVIVFSMVAGVMFGLAFIGVHAGDTNGALIDTLLGLLALVLAIGSFLRKEF